MSGGRARAGAGEYAERVTAPSELLESGVAVAEAAQILADRFGCSTRQARRYAERAAEGGRVAAPEATTGFNIKPAAASGGRGRKRGKASGSSISALVADALTEFLARGHRKRPRG